MEIKGHNSDNNWWILSIIELDLYFMIIYLSMKYESNTLMYSKDTARKPFFVRTGNTYKGDAICPPPPIINGGGHKNCVISIISSVENSANPDQLNPKPVDDLDLHCIQ